MEPRDGENMIMDRIIDHLDMVSIAMRMYTVFFQKLYDVTVIEKKVSDL